jgi:hypothetical protein
MPRSRKAEPTQQARRNSAGPRTGDAWSTRRHDTSDGVNAFTRQSAGFLLRHNDAVQSALAATPVCLLVVVQPHAKMRAMKFAKRIAIAVGVILLLIVVGVGGMMASIFAGNARQSRRAD